MNCKKCYWFKRSFQVGTDAGLCYFNPPTLLISGSNVTGARPPVHQDDFCHNFKWAYLDHKE